MQHIVTPWILVLLLFSLAAEPAAQARPAQARKGAGKPKATFYLYPGVKPRAQVRSVRDTLKELMELRKEIRFVALEGLLEDKRAARRSLKRANKEATRGKDQLSNLEVEEGVKTIHAAVLKREEYFHYFYDDPDELERHAWLLADLAVAHYMAGDETKTRASLLQAFLLHAKMEFDEKRFPPQMKQLFEESHFYADEMGTGDVYIETSPEGAEVRVNGKLVGQSPIMAKGLGPGDNLVSVGLLGYRTRTQRVTVQGGGESSQMTMDLEPLKGSPLTTLQEAISWANNGQVGPGLKKLASRLRVPVIFLAAVGGEEDMVTVSLFAYDGRRKILAGKVSGTVSSLDPEPECRELVNTLINSLRQEPVKRPLVAEEQGDPWYSGITKARWFWPVVGGVAGAAVVAGTTVGIYYGTRGSGGGRDPRKTLILLPAGSPGVSF